MTCQNEKMMILSSFLSGGIPFKSLFQIYTILEIMLRLKTNTLTKKTIIFA